MGLKAILGGGMGKLVESVGSTIDRFIHTGDEKAEVMLEIERIASAQMSEIEETVRAEVGAKERILTAELTQGDSYTKRARPTVVYGGLVALFLNNILMPWAAYFSGVAADKLPTIELPAEFWIGWSGIVATWSVGRTFEKRGVKSKIVNAVTGSGNSKLLDD